MVFGGGREGAGNEERVSKGGVLTPLSIGDRIHPPHSSFLNPLSSPLLFVLSLPEHYDE
jgi:hypothetical protein